MKRLVAILDAPTPTKSAATLADRYRGALHGLAVGNALGIPVEGHSRPFILRRHPDGVRDIAPEERQRPWDDDLAQAVVLAEAVLESDALDIHDVAARLAAWRRDNGRGIGHHTRRVLDAIVEGASAADAAHVVWLKAEQNAAGNGAVMRCAPVALRWRSDPNRLIAETLQSALVTHHDARCGWSAVAVNAAIAASLDGRSLELGELADSLNEAGAPMTVVDAVKRVSGASLDTLELDHDNTMGYTIKAMQAALWALEQPEGLETTLMTIVNAGGDTDTNGAVAGAALGAKHGAGAIPKRWTSNVGRLDELTALADRLLERGTR